MKTLVLGLGNPILSDDGVGVIIAEKIRQLLQPGRQIDVAEASLGGLSLMEMLIGYDRVILIDALQLPDGQPGRIRRLTLADLQSLSPTQHSASPHDASLVTALELGRQMELHLPAEVTIYAVEVANVLDFGEQLTPTVAAAIPLVVRQVLDDVESVVME